MAYPLVGGSVSAGVTKAPLPILKSVTTSLTWNGAGLRTWQPSAAGVVKTTGVTYLRLSAARKWSGAVAEAAWPQWGQGWPRVRQR